ncbi:MAG TPA: DUF4124 domain-containing protein [Steroidobacteraceae bacterium]|nr:DUF4124 domain-containing protein [Steroidobacteraceae bacterium]
MRTSRHTLALALTLALAWGAGAALAQNSDKSITYRWVDEHGVVHYGDTIPPQYSRNSKQILNSEGVQIGQIDAEKTPQQLAAEAHAQARREAQQQHDYFLLSTYTSVKDIESLRDERLAQIEAQQTAAQQYVRSLQSRLTSLQSRAQQFKPYSTRPNAARMPDDLAQELVQTLSEVHAQDQAIDARTQQEAQVRAQFQSDIERFEALRATAP